MDWPSSNPASSFQFGALQTPVASPAGPSSDMFRTSSRTTTPGRIESIGFKAVPTFGFHGQAGYQDGTQDSFALGAQPPQPFQQQQFQQNGGQGAAAAGGWQQQLQQQLLQHPVLPPITTAAGVGAAAGTTNKSFTFQNTANPGPAEPDLETLFSKAEAAVDKYLDSPQAAMLFGSDISDALAQLCSDPSRAAPSIAAAAGCPKAPQTPQSGRKRSKPSAGDSADQDVDMCELSQQASEGRSLPSFSSDARAAGRRWGLDLSDEGSGSAHAVWRHSTGGAVAGAGSAAGASAGAAGALGKNQQQQQHKASASDCCSNRGCSSSAAASGGSNKCSTRHRILKIKVKGGSNHPAARSSCPGTWMAAASKLGRVSSSAAGGAFQACLDLSSPQGPGAAAAAAAAAAATGGLGAGTLSGAGDLGSSRGALFSANDGALNSSRAAGKGGSGGGRRSSSSRRNTTGGLAAGIGGHRTLSGTKHGHGLNLSDASGFMHDAAFAAVLGPVEEEQLMLASHAAKRRLLHGSSETPSPCSMAGERVSTPPAAAGQQNNLSFTSWARDGTAAAGQQAQGAAAGTPARIQSPFSDVAAVAAALFAPSTSSYGSPAGFGSQSCFGVAAGEAAAAGSSRKHKLRRSVSGTRSATAAGAAAGAVFGVLQTLQQQQPMQQQPVQQPVQLQPVHQPAAGHVGVSITTQSGTGPLTRRVSSQVLVTPVGQFTQGDAGLMSGVLPNATHTLDYGLGFASDGGGGVPEAPGAAAAADAALQQRQQQQQLLHLQLPRIRTKSQVLSQGVAAAAAAAASGGVGAAAGLQMFFDTDSSSDNSSGAGTGIGGTGCSSGATSGSEQGCQLNQAGLTLGSQAAQAGPEGMMLSGPGARAAGAAGCGGWTSDKAINPTPACLLNHIADMTLHSNNGSPASIMSSGSVAGVSTPAGAVPVVPAAGPAGAGAGVGYSRGPSPFGLPQLPQLQQLPAGLGEERDAGLVLARGHTITTSLPLPAAAPVATPGGAGAAAGGFEAAADGVLMGSEFVIPELGGLQQEQGLLGDAQAWQQGELLPNNVTGAIGDDRGLFGDLMME